MGKKQAVVRAEKASIRNINIHPDTIVEHNVWFEGNICVEPYTYIDVGAVFCGDITIGYNSLVRCNVSADGKLTVGKQTHVYDQICFTGESSVGDYCWMNHGASVSHSKIGNECAVAVGAATEYGSIMEAGTIVSNHSLAFAQTVIQKNTRVEGVPSNVVQRFMRLEDRQRYFGVSPYLWVQLQGQWIEQDVLNRAEKK